MGCQASGCAKPCADMGHPAARHTSLTTDGEDASDLKVVITVDEKEGLIGYRLDACALSKAWF